MLWSVYMYIQSVRKDRLRSVLCAFTQEDPVSSYMDHNAHGSVIYTYCICTYRVLAYLCRTPLQRVYLQTRIPKIQIIRVLDKPCKSHTVEATGVSRYLKSMCLLRIVFIYYYCFYSTLPSIMAFLNSIFAFNTLFNTLTNSLILSASVLLSSHAHFKTSAQCDER